MVFAILLYGRLGPAAIGFGRLPSICFYFFLPNPEP